MVASSGLLSRLNYFNRRQQHSKGIYFGKRTSCDRGVLPTVAHQLHLIGLGASPRKSFSQEASTLLNPNLRACLKACVRCAHDCEQCVEACLKDENVDTLADCIRTNQDCAQLCWAASALIIRSSDFIVDLCHVCMKVCQRCAQECEKHNYWECAAICRECAEECRKVEAEIQSPTNSQY